MDEAAMLEAQLALLRSDEWILEKARRASSLSMDERMAIAAAMCEEAVFYAGDRALEREPVPADAEAALRRLGGR